MEEAAPTARSKLFTPAFVSVAVASLSYFISIGLVLPVLSRFVKGPLGGNDAAVGLVAGVFSFSAVFVRPLAGWLADRRGRRFLVVSGALLAAAAVGGYTVAGSIAVMVFLRLVNGAGEAFFFTGAMTAVNDLAPVDRRGEAVSFFTVALYSGLALGPLAGEAILVRAGFQAVWWTSCALGFLAAALALRMSDTRPAPQAGSSDPPGAAEATTQGAGRIRNLVQPAAVIPGMVFAASIWGFSGLSSFGPLYALDIGLSGSRLVFGVYSGIILAIRLLGAKIPDRMGFYKTAAVSLYVSAAGLFLVAAWPEPAALYAGVAIFAIGQGLAFPALMGLVTEKVSPAQRGAAVATFTAFLDIAFGLGPLSLGLVAQGLGYPAVFAASGLFAVTGILLLSTQRKAAPARPGL